MMQTFTHDGQEMKYAALGAPDADTVIVWTHGWGHSHHNLLKTAMALDGLAQHIVVDFPGFGDSPMPAETWSPLDYGHFMAVFLQQFTGKRILWVGHSFGCRVGLHIGAHYPDLIDAQCLIAAAGLRRKRSPLKQFYFQARIRTYKILRFMTRYGVSEGWLKSRFASADYRAAGDMRDILVKTVNEDLTETAQAVKCPVTLVFGLNDDQTTPEMGRRYNRYIPQSRLIELEGYDHYSILTDGRHHLSRIIKEIIQEK